MTIANQSEKPIKQYTYVTCFSSIETKSRFFIQPFAVADNKYNILGTPFFWKKLSKFFFKDLTMDFKHSFNDQPTTVSSNSLIEMNFPFVSFTYQNILKKSTHIKPKIVQIIHFPLKKTKTIMLNKPKILNLFSLEYKKETL